MPRNCRAIAGRAGCACRAIPCRHRKAATQGNMTAFPALPGDRGESPGRGPGSAEGSDRAAHLIAHRRCPELVAGDGETARAHPARAGIERRAGDCTAPSVRARLRAPGWRAPPLRPFPGPPGAATGSRPGQCGCARGTANRAATSRCCACLPGTTSHPQRRPALMPGAASSRPTPSGVSTSGTLRA